MILLLLHCYAVVPKTEEREKLKALLRHHQVQYNGVGNMVSVDIHCVSYRTVEKLVSYFEATDADERGFTVIGGESEVPYDSG